MRQAVHWYVVNEDELISSHPKVCIIYNLMKVFDENTKMRKLYVVNTQTEMWKQYFTLVQIHKLVQELCEGLLFAKLLQPLSVERALRSNTKSNLAFRDHCRGQSEVLFLSTSPLDPLPTSFKIRRRVVEELSQNDNQFNSCCWSSVLRKLYQLLFQLETPAYFISVCEVF